MSIDEHTPDGVALFARPKDCVFESFQGTGQLQTLSTKLQSAKFQ